MNVVTSACAASGLKMDWHGINWGKCHQQVRRLQARIVKATQEGRWGKVKALQWLLTHSFSGKAIAVKRVTGSCETGSRKGALKGLEPEEGKLSSPVLRGGSSSNAVSLPDSVLFDVLNRVAIDATLAPANAYEVDLAIAHLAHTQCDDLLLMDRNYPSYRMLAVLRKTERDFAIRCSASSFSVARRMLKGEGAKSQIVTLTPCAEQMPMIRASHLPETLVVRFVRVLLSTGEFEVLVTSLLDETRYPTDDFLALYGLRWGIETFYGLIKTRLTLENFTGLGVEAVKQDFYATVYLSGLESILTDTAQAILDAKETQYPQKVNRAVSFNAIKTQAFTLLMSDLAADVIFQQLTAMFLKNPCLERKDRNPPRKKSSATVLLNYHRRLKKQCF